MAAMVASGSSSSPVSSPLLVQEKGSRNKRKFRSDPPLGDPNKLTSASQTDCSSFEFSAEKSQSNMSHEQHGLCELCSHNQEQLDIIKPDLRLSCGTGSSDVGSSQSKEVPEPTEFKDADWSDITESHLEEIVIKNLDTIYKSAIKKIAACGYGEDVASKAVLRSGLCYGYKDTVSNIVDNTLAFLRNGQEVSTSREHFFENLEQLEKYVLAEMVCVLREVRPFFSIGDAMWCLLICDMNVSQACAMDGEPLSSINNDGSPGCSSSISTPSQLTAEASSCEADVNKPNAIGSLKSSNPKNCFVLDGSSPGKGNPTPPYDSSNKSMSVDMELTQTIRQSSNTEEKPAGARKAHSIAAKRETMLRQKSLHLEKTYRAYGSKGALRQGKLGNLGGLILDKKHRSVSDSPSVDLKSACLKLTEAVGVDVTQTNGNQNPLISSVLSTPTSLHNSETINIQASLSVTDTELTLSQPSKLDVASKPHSSELQALSKDYAGVPFDKALKLWVSDDKKDELILKLSPRVKELQNQLQGWTDWANQKVMQAARRLSKDKSELKTLRQEKEEMARLKKEKQTLEENTMKKLSEMENALCKASGQVDRANSAVQRLELENSHLRHQMEESKVQAAQSAASCLEVIRREKKTMNNFQSWEKQKTFLQEELLTEKRKLVQLQQELEQERSLLDQLEARRKQEKNAKEEYLLQAGSFKKEREQIEASAKSREDIIKLKAENELRLYKDDIRKLESDISQLRLKTDSSKIAALRWGTDGSYVNRVPDGKKDPTIKGSYKFSDVNESDFDFQDSLGNGNLKRERECVMCLTEEMSVVFLPCAHQVVCIKCNELHEKQGMKDCPSCRTPIQRRICVRYARS
ncbi:Mnd1-interacting protein [Thalictrum thalictroides]|uniref:Mnd1-interacting protein n=1 Tax=Thalictrum thalictroides TaxID=46969 RepID=A0A7J6VNV3_THATH|nr:Mnd1-interacting protein [Thalictrum thalictroides]